MKKMVECSGIWRAVHELVAQISCFPDTDISLGVALDKCTSSASRDKFGGSRAACLHSTVCAQIKFLSDLGWPWRASSDLMPCPETPYSAGGSPTHPASPWVPVHADTAWGRAVGKGVIWEIQRKRRLRAATETQQQIGSNSRAGGEQGWTWGLLPLLWVFPIPGSSGRVLWEGDPCRDVMV